MKDLMSVRTLLQHNNSRMLELRAKFNQLYQELCVLESQIRIIQNENNDINTIMKEIAPSIRELQSIFTIEYLKKQSKGEKS